MWSRITSSLTRVLFGLGIAVTMPTVKQMNKTINLIVVSMFIKNNPEDQLDSECRIQLKNERKENAE